MRWPALPTHNRHKRTAGFSFADASADGTDVRRHSVPAFRNRFLTSRSQTGHCTMWKSFLLASGIFACVLGIEMLLIDSAIITTMNGSDSVFRAPDWMPWTLLSVGAATILHFWNLPASTSQSAS
jgi:hypothetical protein